MAKDYEVLNELTFKTQELHRAIFDKGYEQGFNEGFNDGKAQGRNEGLFEAWECAREIVADMVEPHFRSGYMVDIFGCESAITAMKNNSASEAVKRIKAWEEKQKADSEIKAGDEVESIYGTNIGKKYVITKVVNQDYVNALAHDGEVGYVNPANYRKTGKHFDLTKILE